MEVRSGERISQSWLTNCTFLVLSVPFTYRYASPFPTDQSVYATPLPAATPSSPSSESVKPL